MATKTSTTKKASWSSLVNFIAFIAVVFVGIALMLSKISMFASISTALTLIASIISYAIVGYFSFNYVKRQRHWAFWLIWALSIALIVLHYFL